MGSQHFGEKDFDPGCVFCIATSHEEMKCEVENTVLFETENFFVIPTLGAFVEGYLLICSKSHFDNFFSLPTDLANEFKLLKEKTCRIVENAYGPIFVFEHGGGGPERQSGAACVDHAHLHIVPLAVDVRECVDQNGSSTVCSIDAIPANLRCRSNYFYFERQGVGELLMLQQRPPRQFVRKLICEKIGISEFWDYRVHYFRDNVVKTISRLAAQF